MNVTEVKTVLDMVVQNIGQVILGKEGEIRQALCCWLAGGHVLFEDVPGTGKTILSRAIAASVGGAVSRVQFTPDLLPHDIIGTTIYKKDSGEFQFLPGPIFTSILLADEINRATPRTQSALLQAMAEGQCSVENQTYMLPPTFFVMATQNPVEQHGTFPLPEAQLDRFMMRLSLGYPSDAAEIQLIKSQMFEHPISKIGAVTSEQTWIEIQRAVRRVHLSDQAIQYAHALVAKTRKHPDLALAASPRATIALTRCAQAYSMMAGLDFVKPDFIKFLSTPILGHRLALTTKARLDQKNIGSILQEIIQSERVPVK